MRKGIIYIVLVVSVIFLKIGCIYPVDIERIEFVEKLIVEGDINIGEVSLFKISVTTPIDPDSDYVQTFTGEVDYLWVESESGDKILATHLGKNTENKYEYSVDTRNISPDSRYKLCFTHPIKGEYESTLQKAYRAPEIEKIEYELRPIYGKERNEVITISVTCRTDTESSFFMSDVAETWEVLPRDESNVRYNPATNFIEFIDPNDDLYRCWSTTKGATEVMINSSEYVGNRVKYEILNTHLAIMTEKLARLYYIEVRQKSVSKEAFVYWSKIYNNETIPGSIFATLPLNAVGNIFSLNNPDESVIGYISLGTYTRTGLYISLEEIDYEFADRKCYAHTASSNPDMWEKLYNLGHDIISFEIDSDNNYTLFWAMKECVNCRGNITKPDFWPN